MSRVAAASAAARIDSADGSWPVSAFAACPASIGRSPTLSSAMRASAQRPFSSSCTTAATPTSAKSPCRLDTSWNAKPLRFGRGGIRISVNSSPGWTAVENNPTKNSSAGTSRGPDWTAHHQARLQRQHDRRQLGGRIGVRKAAADGAAIANRRMRDVRHRFSDERHALGHEPAALNGALACHATDPHIARVVLYIAELGKAVQIHQHRWRGEPEVHRRNEALPAGQRLRIAAVLGEQRQRFVERLRTKVFERCWFHFLMISARSRAPSNHLALAVEYIARGDFHHNRAFNSLFNASSACFVIILPTDSSRRCPTAAILPPICTSDV